MASHLYLGVRFPHSPLFTLANVGVRLNINKRNTNFFAHGKVHNQRVPQAIPR